MFFHSQPHRSLRVIARGLLAVSVLPWLLVGSVTAAELTYDSDSNAGNGITEGAGPGWNTTITNKPWTNTGGTLSEWINANNDTAVFGSGTATATGNLNVNVGTVTAGGIIFKAATTGGSYILNNGTITLAGATPTITANVESRINSRIVSTSLIKEGAGTLILSNSGNSLGNITINAGRLDVYLTLASDDVVVNGAAGFITHSGNTWNMRSLTYSSTAGSNFYAAGADSNFTIGAGGLTFNNTGSLSINADNASFTSRIILQGDITVNQNNGIYAGGNALAASTQRMLDLSAGDRTVMVALDKTFNINVTISNGGLTKTGNGRLTLGGASSNLYTGTTTVSAGTLGMAKTGGAVAIAGDVVVNTGAILDWDVANQLATTSSITLNGGSLKLDNFAQTITNLTQTAGAVNLAGNSNSGFFTITGLLRVSGGSSINLNSAGVWNVYASDFTGYNGTVVSLNGNSPAQLNQFIVGEGGMILTGQTISLPKGTAAGARGSELLLNGDVTASSNNFIVVGANTVGVSQVNLGSEDRTLNITGGTTRSAAPFVSTGGGLIKDGAGTLELNAINTYTGNTFVKAGTLLLGASSGFQLSPIITVGQGGTLNVSAISGFSVGNSQELRGGGTVTGNMSIAAAGILAPGTADVNTLQTLTFSNNLTLSNGSYTYLQISAEGNDQIKGSAGSFTQQNGALIYVLAPEEFDPIQGQSFKLFDWTGLASFSSNLGPNYRDGANEGSYDLILPNLIGTGFVWDISQFATSGLLIVAVPEPSRLFFMLFAVGAVFWRRRRSH